MLTVELDRSICEELKPLLAGCEALLDSMNTAIAADGDGPGNLWRYSGYQHYIRKYNQLAHAVRDLDPKLTVLLDSWIEDNIPSEGNTVPQQQKNFFVGTHANLSMLKSLIENRIGLKEDKIRALTDFLKANLRKAIHNQPDREQQIQDAVETLLIGRGLQKGLDYDRESGHVKIANKHSIPDFILRKMDLAIEIKLSKDERKSKVIVDEIGADTVAYRQIFSKILFVVYDLGSIRDEVEYVTGLPVPDGVSIIVVKH